MPKGKLRIAIAGAGNVSRSVARELLTAGHKVLLIERDPHNYEPHTAPGADWMLADACELTTLEEAGIETCDVFIAATGDDRANLVIGLLTKTEFGVPRVVARINNVDNHWLFSQWWGIDIAVSTPGALVASVEGAIDVGHLVRLMRLREGRAELTKLTLPDDHPIVGQRVDRLNLPDNTVLVTVVRGREAVQPKLEDVFQSGDELLFVTNRAAERSLLAALHSSRFLRGVTPDV